MSAATRLPALWQDQSPYMFCDEEWLFYPDVIRMLRTDSLSSSMFLSGPMNVYPVWIVTRFIEFFVPLSDSQVLLIGRFILPFGLGALSVIPLALFIKYLTGLRYVGLIGVALYVLSSFLSAVSRYWYPDHFIFFFAALVAMFSARLIIVDKPYLTSFLLGLSSSLVFSVKYHSAILGIMIVFAFVMRHKRLGLNIPRKREVVGSVLTFLSTSVGFTLLFHLNSILRFDQLLDQQRSNLENYSQPGAELIEGMAAYGFVAFVLTVGPLGFVLALAAAFYLIKTRQFLYFSFLVVPVFALIFILGSQGLFITRNIIPISPLLLALFAIGVQASFSRFSERHSVLGVSLRIAVSLLASAQIVLALYAFTQDLRPDSRTLAQGWIQQNVPRAATIGTNESCFGQSPAKAAGRETVSDPQMEKGLDFYVFDSYGGGVISSLFRDDQGGIALLEPKYLHYYHFNNRGIYKALPGLLQQQNVPSIDGYKVVEIFRENGPEVWVWKRSD
jgi:MFS family permease